MIIVTVVDSPGGPSASVQPVHTDAGHRGGLHGGERIQVPQTGRTDASARQVGFTRNTQNLHTIVNRC